MTPPAGNAEDDWLDANRYFLDLTHLDNRRVTGIERMSIEQFGPDLIADATARPITTVRARGRWSMLARQLVDLPQRMIVHRRATMLCPGFPPSIPLMTVASSRVVACIHDLFPLTQSTTLNRFGRLYIAPTMRYCLRRGRRFIVFSETMRDELCGYVRPNATIHLYRPFIRNVLELTAEAPTPTGDDDSTIHVLSIGTVEPRKNYAQAAAICRAAGELLGRPVVLDIVGRAGWGSVAEQLRADDVVRLHGYLDPTTMNRLVGRCHLFFYPTLAEGLGLPALEAQYSGLPVLANDLPILRETLATSAAFVDVTNVTAAARLLAALLSDRAQLDRMRAASLANLTRWNALARQDRAALVGLLNGNWS